MNILGTITRKCNRDINKLNILTCPTHESQETIFSNAFPHNTIYGLYHKDVKTWNETFRPIPKNYILLKDGKIPIDLDIDIVISQNRFGQYQILSPIAQRYNIPLICIEHTATMPQWNRLQLQQLRNMCGNVNIFITKFSQNMWGFNDTNSTYIEHAIDSNQFCPKNEIKREPYILSVCNQFTKQVRFQPCGFPLYQQVIQPGTKQSLPYKHLGAQDQPFGQPAKNLDDLILNYQKAAIFINTSLLSPIPMSLQEAASCSCAIVSTSTCDIPNIFTHGENALLSNNPQELRQYCIELLNNQPLREKLGNNARKMIQERFTMEKFINSWQKAFKKALGEEEK